MTGTRPARQLSRAALATNTASASFDALRFDGLAEVAAASAGEHAPHPRTGTDPRLDLTVVYNEARATRPTVDAALCAVCDNLTCPAVDVAELPGGDLAYLTPNLYPITYPHPAPSGARGVHLVHWSSLRHDGGLPGADRDTAAALLRQLARAEAFLLHGAPDDYPDTGDGHRGHVGVIKNRGELVGGSVEHDHQQILLAAARPTEPAATVGLRARLLRETAPALRVECIDDRATTLVPAFMRRPLHAFVVPHDDDAGWLHHLAESTLDAVAFALARLCAAASLAPAYNLLCHAGPGLGPLFELRPYTQPLGGYEHLGLYLCEQRPEAAAERLRASLPA